MAHGSACLSGVRKLIALVLMLVPTVAAANDADQEAVAKLVRANIAASITTHCEFAATTVRGFEVIPAETPPRGIWDASEFCGAPGGDGPIHLFGSWETRLQIDAFTPHVVIDDPDRAAWFSAEVRYAGTGDDGSNRPRGTWPIRIMGLAIDDGGWKIAAVEYSYEVAEANQEKWSSLMPTYRLASQRSPLEHHFAGWIGHLSAHRSAHAFSATGIGPHETATDARGMAQLATRWDRIPLTLKDVNATEVGNVAWVELVTTRRTKTGVVILTLGMIAVKDGDDWRWVALNWHPDTLLNIALH